VLRIIARMNVGGPAYHVSLLSGRLDPDRFETLLVHGQVGRGEASFEELARREGCAVHPLADLRPEIDPRSDARTLRALVRLVREYQPDIVHTHTAKAGFVGRLAAALTRPRPLIVHTYHGHVLEGYFGPAKNALYRSLERGLARVSDRLVAVSQATVDDLVRLRVASPERFMVIPIGLDLERFRRPDLDAGAEFRRASGAGDEDLLLGFVGRLVPIKRVDVLLNAFAKLREQHDDARLAIVGDGEERPALEQLAAELRVASAVTFHGFMADVAPVAAASDIAVLSSDNEGTPVSLIEAAAAARPAVATDVGGVRDVVGDGGLVVPPGDPEAFAAALHRLADDPAERVAMGERAQRHVLARHSVDRLLADVGALYEDLLLTRRGAAAGAAAAS
jgi:glycosyltransferase involved in cell wall biosynthesis